MTRFKLYGERSIKRLRSRCRKCREWFSHWNYESGELCNLCMPKRVTW